MCLLDSARVAGVSLETFFARQGRALDEALRAELELQVRGAAQAVIARKGATSHAIAMATARIVRALVRDERAVLPVSVAVEPGLCLGAPAIVGHQGARATGLPQLSERERAAWERSVAAVRAAVAPRAA